MNRPHNPIFHNKTIVSRAYSTRGIKNNDINSYLPFNAIHGPFQAPQSLVEKHKDEPDKKRRIVKAMLDSMDKNVSKVLATLKENGLEENTLVVFLSDNGGHEASPTTPARTAQSISAALNFSVNPIKT